MVDRVVVVGAGYAGAGIINALADRDAPVEVTWISTEPYHVVKHEAHRGIRSPAIEDGLRIPVEEIRASDQTFQQGRVVDLDPTAHTISLADGTEFDYDTLVLTIGARTPFYGIPGLEEHALLLESLGDAVTIHEAVDEALEKSPARVVVGGGGLSGVQTAGEIDAFAEQTGRDVQITLVEALETILPNAEPALRTAIEDRLRNRDIELRTDAPIVGAGRGEVELAGGDRISCDVLVWTGGIAGWELGDEADLERMYSRIRADASLQTSESDIFAFGDAAAVEQPAGVAPPTAQAAWQAAPVAATNVIAKARNRPLTEWTFSDKGTVVSVGDAAVAHGVKGIPIDTFGSFPARTLKKAIAARWIAQISSWRRALRLWSDL